MKKNHLLNIHSNRKHSTLEYLIKKYDPSQDMSRAAVFEREVRAAQGVKNWKDIQRVLMSLKKEPEAPLFSSLQAKYDDETADILEKVKEEIREQLSIADPKGMQTQYMVQLLQANYLVKLKEEETNTTSETILENNISFPEMAKILTEMILTDKDCTELRRIRGILAEWKNKG